MRYLHLSRVYALLLATYAGLEIAAATSQDKLQTHRVLRAATKRTSLYGRSMRIQKRFEAEVAYIEEENGWDRRSTFASQVKVISQKPVTNLEEIEHHLQDVRCKDGKLRLDFVDLSSARDAFYSCHGQDGGLIITSHDGCNEDGERSVYRVDDVSFADDGHALELSVTETLWQDAFDYLSITFADTTDDHLFRRHSDFAKIRKKRQSVDIPVNTPDTVVGAEFGLSSQLLNTTFTADSFLSALLQLTPVPTAPIAIGCNNCTTAGHLKLTQGAISINASQIDIIPDVFQGGDDGKEIKNLITGGFFEIVATGMSAHLDMFARPEVSGSYEVVLFKAPILGFVIPGIGKAGMTFEPKVAVKFAVGGALELNYGVDIAVPDDSKIHIELTDTTKSVVTGFSDATVNMLPIVTNATNFDIQLGVAFQPTIPIGFEFSNKLKSEVLVSMNLPRLDAKLSSDIAANCGGTSNATSPYANTTNGEAPGSGTPAPFVLAAANLSISVDVGVHLKFPLLPPPPVELGVIANVFSTNMPLVRSCTLTIPGDVTSTTTETSTMQLTTTMHATPTTSAVSCQLNASKSVTQESVTLTESWVPHSSSQPLPTTAPYASITSSADTTTTILVTDVVSSMSANATDIHSSISCNGTISSANVSTTTTTLSIAEPVPTVLTSTSFLAPGNASVATSRPSASAQPSSAATHGFEMPKLKWSEMEWQIAAIGFGALLGALVL